MITVVIADDHKIFRDGLKLLFRKEGNFKLAGEAATGKELIELVKLTKPDVIITDIKMPQMNGTDAVKEIISLLPDARILALSMHDEEHMVKEVLEAGALGYLLKDVKKEEILEAINYVLQGKVYYSSTFSFKLVRLLSSSNYNPHKVKSATLLNEKEIEIIDCICKELTNKEIADKVDLSIRTVEWYRAKIMEKLDVKSTTGMVIYAITNNLINIKDIR